MTLWSRLLSWWAALFRRPRMETEMNAELRFHIESYAEDLARRGVPAGEAMRRARAAFGALDRAREECRDASGVNLVEGFIQDVRHGLRVLRKNPGFTAVALASLGLGIGANSTIFSIVESQLLRPWPVKEPERLVAIRTNSPKEPDFDTSSYPDYCDIAAEISGFSGVVAYGNRGGFISREGQGRELNVEVVAPNYFTMLGVSAQRGRMFSGRPEETAAEGSSVVLSHGLWQDFFGGDPALPGKTTLLDGKQFTVIGVAPPDFRGLRRSWSPDIWVTTGGWTTMVPGEDQTYIARDNRWFALVGRLSPGASIAQARAQLRTLARRLALASSVTNRDVEFAASPAAVAGKADLRFGMYLIAMVGLVLLISCANVANLLLAQMEKRQREIAMRRALGAAQPRLVRQLFTEGLVLSSGGGLLGVFLARLLMRTLPALAPELAAAGLRLDLRELLFTAAISLLMAALFGQAPALYAARRDLTGILKGAEAQVRGSARHLPLRSLIVLGEVALSVVLLAGSALLVRSLIYSQRINPGFDVKKNVLMMEVAPPPLYGYTEAQAAAIYPALAARAAMVPGVVRVSYSRRPPLTSEEGGEKREVIIPGVDPPRESGSFKIRFNTVGPRFFGTVGARERPGLRRIRSAVETAGGHHQRCDGAPVLARWRRVRQVDPNGQEGLPDRRRGRDREVRQPPRIAATIPVPAFHSRVLIRVHADSGNGRRSPGFGAVDFESGRRGGPESPARRHHNAAQLHAGGTFAGASHGVAAAGGEHFGHVPGGCRPVRHGRLRGQPAHARNRRQDGVGRPAEPDHVAGADSGAGIEHCRRPHWSRRRCDGFAPDLRIRLWDHRARPPELHDQCAGRNWRGTVGIVLPGTAGDAG